MEVGNINNTTWETGLSSEAINNVHYKGSDARNNLTVIVDPESVINNNTEGRDGWKYFAKVCCVCDRLIKYNKGKFCQYF